MVVELHRKVSSLIEYLKQKWAYHDQRIVSFFKKNITVQYVCKTLQSVFHS